MGFNCIDISGIQAILGAFAFNESLIRVSLEANHVNSADHDICHILQTKINDKCLTNKRNAEKRRIVLKRDALTTLFQMQREGTTLFGHPFDQLAMQVAPHLIDGQTEDSVLQDPDFLRAQKQHERIIQNRRKHKR